MNNLWILTEERPKKNVLIEILNIFCEERRPSLFEVDKPNLHIRPIMRDGKFLFIYELVGVSCNLYDKIYIKTISGGSSFVDFLVFYQEKMPTIDDKPIYAIEETKTDDSESRNTGVYQRATKFVYIDTFYPETRKIMFYNLRVKQKEKPTATSIFGTRMLRNLGVEIRGKVLSGEILEPFRTIDELINYKNSMRRPPKGNTPIIINISPDRNTIEVSGKLLKANSLSHDPNIGALSLISKCLRLLKWEGNIILTQHGLKQIHVLPRNKFIRVANRLNIKLQGLEVPKSSISNYWSYKCSSEKVASIFIHIVAEEYGGAHCIFENHAGCERGYITKSDSNVIAVVKYTDKEKYKLGDKTKIYSLPDLVLLDCKKSEILNIEAKIYANRLNGIKELNNYDPIERNYISEYYPGYKINRSVVAFGGEKKIKEKEVSFLLNLDGTPVVNDNAPNLIKRSIALLNSSSV